VLVWQHLPAAKEVAMKPVWRLLLLGSALLGLGCDDQPVAIRDRTPPAAIADLAATWTVDTTVLLAWSAPGDDGDAGTATRYEIRYATGDLGTEAPLEAATSVLVPVAHAAGSREAVAVGGLQPDGIYAFRVRAADEAANWSAWSNVAAAPSSNALPVPQFLLRSDSLAVGDTLVADATSTHDAESGTAVDLRWDWDGDGSWDSVWSPTPVATHVIALPGRYAVRLQARDLTGGTAEAEHSIVARAFTRQAQRNELFVQVSGDCCSRNANEVCRSCWTRFVAADSTCADTSVERRITYQSAAAHALQRVQTSAAGWSVATDVTTLDGEPAASASANCTSVLLLQGALSFTIVVHADPRSGTGSATWGLRLLGPDAEVVADLGGNCLTGPPDAEYRGRLAAGVCTLQSRVEATSTCDASMSFDIVFGAASPTPEVR
jgi:hypothetical protein